MADEDCPLCQLMADQPGPVFWHLDGCNMDDDFPFSFHATREEWEKERRSWEEFNRRFEEEQKGREAGLLEDDASGDDEAGAPSVWVRSLSNTDGADVPPSIVLFGIGSHLAELGSDLNASPDTAALADRLNRHFDNLRAALGEPSAALVEPVVERFCEELRSVTEARMDLADKCADLERQLTEFAARVSGESGWDDDLPF
jgi:hypothetical protein